MRRVLFVVAAYIAAQMFSDVMSLRLILIGSFAVDAGTLIYPITFTLRDMAHKTLGKRLTRTLIITAAAINLVMAFAFWLTAKLPTLTEFIDPASPDYDAPTALFGSVLSPVFRIVAASIIAEVVAELVDTEIYHQWVTRITKRHQWARVLVSNAVSVPLDSVIFVMIAFAGRFPTSVIIEIMVINVVVKFAATLLSMWMIYLVPEGEQVSLDPAVDQ